MMSERQTLGRHPLRVLLSQYALYSDDFSFQLSIELPLPQVLSLQLLLDRDVILLQWRRDGHHLFGLPDSWRRRLSLAEKGLQVAYDCLEVSSFRHVIVAALLLRASSRGVN